MLEHLMSQDVIIKCNLNYKYRTRLCCRHSNSDQMTDSLLLKQNRGLNHNIHLSSKNSKAINTFIRSQFLQLQLETILQVGVLLLPIHTSTNLPPAGNHSLPTPYEPFAMNHALACAVLKLASSTPFASVLYLQMACKQRSNSVCCSLPQHCILE